MLEDLSRIGPVLVMSGVAALILIWDFLPVGKPFPAARGKALMAFALLGPIGAAIWTAVLMSNDVSGPAFDYAVVLDDMSFFFYFLFAGITAAIIMSTVDYVKRFGDYESEFFALVLFATSAMLLLSASRDLILI